jgi:hypothetical protein
MSHTTFNSRGTASLGLSTNALPLTHGGLGGSGNEVVSDKGFHGRVDELNVFNRALYDIDASLLGDQLYRFDVDGDGVPDITDAFPQDPAETLDADGDGVGNNADLDDDNDGMSDLDEALYGFDSMDPTDASEDADKDGMSNGDEIFAGMNPSDSNSLFAVSRFESSASSINLQWVSVSGRTYFVEYSDDLVAWLPLPGAESVLAIGNETGIVDTNIAANVRFYRAGVAPE